MSFRKEATAYLLDVMGRINKSGRNKQIYEDMFKRMNDEQYDQYVTALAAGYPLTIFVSNYKKADSLDYDNLVKLSESLGLNIMTQVIIHDEDNGIEYTTPETYFVGSADVRKQRQRWAKKFGGAKDDTQIADDTGQVFGKSRGTAISMPEIRVLENLGLTAMAVELYDVKGGDLGSLDAYRSNLQETGRVSLREAVRAGTGVKSLRTAQSLLMGRHLDSNIGERS